MNLAFRQKIILTVKLNEASFPSILKVQGKPEFRILYYGNRSSFGRDNLHCSIEPIKKYNIDNSTLKYSS